MSRCKTSRDKLINALNEQLGNLTLLHRQICDNNGFSLWSLPLCMFSIINSLLKGVHDFVLKVEKLSRAAKQHGLLCGFDVAFLRLFG